MTTRLKPIYAGIAGASLPALALACIGSLGAVANLLLPLVYLGALAVVLGSSAGWLTSRFWHSYRQAVAFILGAVAISSSLAVAFLMWSHQPALSVSMTNTQWILLSMATDISSGILVQLFVLCWLAGLRRLVRRPDKVEDSLRQ